VRRLGDIEIEVTRKAVKHDFLGRTYDVVTMDPWKSLAANTAR
jgi:hypothetical protein